MFEPPKPKIKPAVPESRAQGAAVPPRPLKANQQQWTRYYSGARDGIQFQLRIERTKTGHLHARYQTNPGRGSGWHLEGQLREDNSFALVGTDNEAHFEGTLSALGSIQVTRFQNKEFKLENLVLRRTVPEVVRIAVRSSTEASTEAAGSQTGTGGASTAAPAALKVGQEWERWYSVEHQGLKLRVNIHRLKTGKLTGRYGVGSAGILWELEGELRKDGTFVLRGTQNGALFEGSMSAQGPIALARFKRGAFEVAGLKLERSAAPGGGEVEAIPEEPAGEDASETGELGQETAASAARWTSVSGSRRREIEGIPRGGYTGGENRQMAFGVETGSLNGVKGYYNGVEEARTWGSHLKNGIYYGMKWQCVEYVRRYTHVVTGKYIDHKGDAKTFYNKSLSDGAATFDGLVQHRNTSKLTGEVEGSKTKPKPNDVIVIGTNTYGHVAIIAEVNDDNVEIAQQNVGTRFKQRLSMSAGAEKWILGGNTLCWLSPS